MLAELPHLYYRSFNPLFAWIENEFRPSLSFFFIFLSSTHLIWPSPQSVVIYRFRRIPEDHTSAYLYLFVKHVGPQT